MNRASYVNLRRESRLGVAAPAAVVDAISLSPPFGKAAAVRLTRRRTRGASNRRRNLDARFNFDANNEFVCDGTINLKNK